ncbi:MAG: hypothetical protein WA797_11345, partial [Acidimicrobiales bacterium]
GPGVAPASERPLGEAAWRAEVRRRAVAVAGIIDSIDWTSPSTDDAEAARQQTALVRSTDALAVSLPGLTLTEAARTLRLATAVIEQALAAQRLGATEPAGALLDAGRRIWAINADDARIAPTLGSKR